MNITPVRTDIFQEGDNLVQFILRNIRGLKERSIIIVTSKIVALAERRTAVGTLADNERLIRHESSYAVRTQHTWLTIKDGAVMASAGIDESNGNGKLILLPRDSYASARMIRNVLRRAYRLKHLGVVITDSRTIPLRAGVTGVALGYAGFRGVKDYRGTPDIFGRKLHITRVDVADSVATAAVLVMGEGREQQPLAIIDNAPVAFCDRIVRTELNISLHDDMYRPLFEHLPRLRL